MLKTLGRYAEAEAAYRDGTRAGESDLFVHYGNFLVERGRPAEAESVLLQGLQHDARGGCLRGLSCSTSQAGKTKVGIGWSRLPSPASRPPPLYLGRR